MPRRIIVPTTLAAVVAAGAVAASPADAAAPFRVPPQRADRFVLPMPRVPDQAYTRDLLYRPAVPGGHVPKPSVPGLPTWPVDPEPVTAPVEAAPLQDEERGEWVLVGLGLIGASVAAGGVAGVVRRYRVRARRFAV